MSLKDDEMMFIIINVPKKTVKLEVLAKTYDDDDIVKFLSTYDLEDIREGRNMYLSLDPSDDAFTRYKLTDIAEAYLANGGDMSWEEWRKLYG